MTQHELDASFDMVPQRLAVRMCVYDKTLRAAEQIGEEVSKNIHGCFMPWQRTQTHPVHFQFHTLRPQAKLEKFRFDPFFVLSLAYYGSIICFSPGSHDSAVPIVIHHRRNLRIASYMFLTRETSNTMDFWYLAWFE
jgi:hypothetical protein